MKKLTLLTVLLLTACGDSPHVPRIIYDQCLRAQLFNQCIKTIPPGPVATKYNDWDEVVAECGRQATAMSVRLRENIKPECQAE